MYLNHLRPILFVLILEMKKQEAQMLGLNKW